MKNFKIKGWIIADAVVTVLALWGIGSYNSLVGMDEEVNGKWANVRRSISVAATSSLTS